MRILLTKRGVWVFVGFIAILIAFIFAFNSWYKASYISFIEHKTQVALPSNISQLDVYDNGEFSIVAHMKLPDEAVEAFVQENSFSPQTLFPRIVSNEESPVFSLESWSPHFRYLAPLNQTIPANADLQFLGDRCGGFVIDMNSGRLWVFLRYPDRSGDIGC